MVADLAIYTVVHQPRRLKLPAQPIPRGASIEDITHCLFDERMNERCFKQVAQYSYYPAAHMFLDLVRRGMKLSIGFSLSFVRQAQIWEPALLELFRELVAEENVELIGVEPYHSFLFLLDIPAFIIRMQAMAQELETIFGKRPVVTDTTEMCMSATLYNALDAAGFRGAVMDGRPWVMDWRETTHLYRNGDSGPYAQPVGDKRAARAKLSTKRARAYLGEERTSSPYLLTRHHDLSDDIGYRFSDRGWSDYPLYADTYAGWLANTWGDMLLLGWDFETFGEHQRQDSGIFDFIRALPFELKSRGVNTYTASELIERHQNNVHHLPLPIYPTTWAGAGGMDLFLGNEAQKNILQLMGHVYGMAKLTENPELIDLALWLLQSDHLDLIQWSGRGESAAEIPSDLTPSEWSSLGTTRLVHEQQQVYINVLRAMEPYLPARLLRQSERRPARSRVLKPGLKPELALTYASRRA